MEITIQLDSTDRQLELFGPGDRYLRLLRQYLDVQITARQNKVTVKGQEKDVQKAVDVISRMERQLQRGHSLATEDVTALIRQRETDQIPEDTEAISVFSHRKVIKPSTKGQQKYIKTMPLLSFLKVLKEAKDGEDTVS